MAKLRTRSFRRLLNRVSAGVCVVAPVLALALAAASCSSVETNTEVSTTLAPQATIGQASTSETSTSETSTSITTAVIESPVEPVRTGAGVLVDSRFEQFAGQMVGVIVNQTSTVDGAHLVDLIDQSDVVELGAIFGPEHGVRGVADAGEQVVDSVDLATGVAVYSLYNADKQPSDAMFEGLDTVFYDLQDVGTRHYTYISTMGLAMQTAARNGVTFVVLDRPNPLGARLVSGPVLESSQLSFIGQYPIPSVYGMTAGELAQAIAGEGWLEGLEDLDLHVVHMQHWTRDMVWSDTGLEWVAPSPGLQTFEAALAYPGTVLVEATDLSYGNGTPFAFAQVGATWVDGDALAATLNEVGLAGVTFSPVEYVPTSIPDVAEFPRLQGEDIRGVRLTGMDLSNGFDPFATGLHVLRALQDQADQQGRGSIIERTQIFGLLTGSSTLLNEFNSGTSVESLLASLVPELEAFDELRQPYLIY